MRTSGCIRVFLGIFITLALISVGAYAVSRHYIEKYGAIPEKPIYPEEQGVAFAPTQTRAPNAPADASAAKSKPGQAKTAKPAAKPVPQGDLAVVTWPEGLLVRASASVDGEQVGGIEYKREVYLLETTPDQAWQQIKVANGDLQGWVKGGNLELTGNAAPTQAEQPPGAVAPAPAQAEPATEPAAEPAPVEAEPAPAEVEAAPVEAEPVPVE
jgi:hypothetical protein